MYNEEEIRDMNRTARSGGAIGSNAVVPRFVILSANEFPLERTLDYGSGPKAIHTDELRAHRIECHAWDVGDNFNPNIHWSEALNRKYNTVMMSNVLNVQPSRTHLETMLKEVVGLVNDIGRLVCNYPATPRKSDVKKKELVKILKSHFKYVVEVGTNLFECYNLSTVNRHLRAAGSISH